MLSGDSDFDKPERSRFLAWTFILSSFVSWIIVTIGIGILVTITLLLVGFSETASINAAILVSYLAIIPLTILLIYADGSIDLIFAVPADCNTRCGHPNRLHTDYFLRIFL